MYQQSYVETFAESSSQARHRERQALQHSIDVLEAAKPRGPGSPELTAALFYTNRVWSFLLEDLSLSDNELPDEIRAGLVSIGLWVMRELEAIRSRRSQDIDGIIEISALIRDALR